ncbi:MAG: MoaD/ThiS family protein [Anaerolineae bacterium]
MPIYVVPVGHLKDYTGGQERVAVPAEGKTVREILADLGIPSEVVAAILIRDILVPKDHIPQDGDEVKLLSVLGGG